MASIEQSSCLLQVFADATRVRLMALLEREELSVVELTRITQLSQSRVSTHLSRLREAGAVRDRRAGSSAYYRVNDATMAAETRRLWDLVRGDLTDPVLDADQARCGALLEARDQSWPDSVAGQMERHYSPGRTWEALARAFLGLSELGDVLDVGSGDGTVAQLLLPTSRSMTCIDRSPRLIDAARARLGDDSGVDFVVGDMHALPFEEPRFDQVFALNVLQCSVQPELVVSESARVLRPGGLLVVVTLAEHEHRQVTEPYGHVSTGFSPDGLSTLLRAAGLQVDSCKVTSRERRKPHFQIVTAFAWRPQEDRPS